MTEDLTIEQVDADGALREAGDKLPGVTRSGLLKGALTGGAVLGGAAFLGLPDIAQAKSKSQDIKILNFALTLEYLEAAFYQEVNDKGTLSGLLKDYAKLIGSHENAHVAALSKALGSKAVKKPKFDFRDTTTDPEKFVKTSYGFENLGVRAYAGQGPHIKTYAYVRVALEILTVEARHASLLAALSGYFAGNQTSSTPDGPFDKPAEMSTVLKDVKSLHFIQ